VQPASTVRGYEISPFFTLVPLQSVFASSPRDELQKNPRRAILTTALSEILHWRGEQAMAKYTFQNNRNYILAVILPFFGIIFTCHSGYTQAFCDAVLKPEVFNVGSTSNTLTFASHFKDVFCRKRWQSELDLQQRSKDAGFNYQDTEKIIDFNFSDANYSSKRNAAYDQFCQKNEQDIAYSRTFFNTFRSSDGAVSAWQQCVLRAEGHFGLSVPSDNLTGASVKLTKVGTGGIPDLTIQSVQPSGDYEISCTYNGKDVTAAQFPKGQREVVITCTKAANLAVTFSINSTWGEFDGFSIPGYNDTITQLQNSINQLGAQVGNLSDRVGLLERNNEQLVKNLKTLNTQGPRDPTPGSHFYDPDDAKPKGITSTSNEEHPFYCNTEGYYMIGINFISNSTGVHSAQIMCSKLVRKADRDEKP
jgi:hypothetical protein